VDPAEQARLGRRYRAEDRDADDGADLLGQCGEAGGQALLGVRLADRPASYVGSDLLAIGGVDLRRLRWDRRRGRLAQLAAT